GRDFVGQHVDRPAGAPEIGDEEEAALDCPGDAAPAAGREREQGDDAAEDERRRQRPLHGELQPQIAQQLRIHGLPSRRMSARYESCSVPCRGANSATGRPSSSSRFSRWCCASRLPKKSKRAASPSTTTSETPASAARTPPRRE